jgi:capsular exopolysaccharide synthesis family protein
MSPPSFVEEAREYLVLLHRRRALVVACTGAALLVAAFHNATARPLFEATVQIFIDRTPPRVLPSAISAGEGETGDDYQTQYELLRGRALADKVVARLGRETEAELSTGPLLTPWSRLRQAVRPPATPVRPPEPAAMAGEAFRSRVTVEPLPGSRLVNVRFRAYDADLAARALNTLAELYIEQALDLEFATATEAARWLAARLLEQQKKLEEAEQSLQRFKERERLVDAGPGRSLTDGQLLALNEALVAARTDRLTRQTLVDRVRSTPPSELGSLPVVIENPVVQGMKARLAELRDEERKLSETLGERHPDLLSLQDRIAAKESELREETSAIVRSVEAAYETAVQQEARLGEELATAKALAFAQERTTLRSAVLEREVESRRSLLRELTARAQQTSLEAQLRFTNLRIVERAEPPRVPVLPRRAFNYQLALLIGLGLGVGLAVLVGRIDDTVKTPDDIAQLLGLPFLGMVPAVDQDLAPEPGPRLAVARAPQSAVAEAYRVVRTNLIFRAPAKRGQVVVMSSSSPGEGKTTTLANLAVSLAQNGARVLAIDADLRRPTLHAHFGLESAEGLSDVLSTAEPRPLPLRETDIPGLRLLSSGRIPENPAELLGSASLRGLLEAERERYDWILIDAPPILAMADAPILSALADGLVMVVWSEHCTRPALKRSLEQVRGVGGKLTGVVLNRVDLKRNAYYYGQYYGEYYRRYYAEGEAAALAAR